MAMATVAAQAGYRPHPFGETPNPLLFETSKDGRCGGCPAGWGAGLAPLAKRHTSTADDDNSRSLTLHL